MQARDYQLACHDAVLKAWGLEPWRSQNLWLDHHALATELGHVPWFLDEVTRGYRSALAVLGTAAGKTIITAQIIETLVGMGARVLFCADTDELCQQPLDKIFAVTGIRPQVEKATSKAYALRQALDLGACSLELPRSQRDSVCVASVQTLMAPGRMDEFAARWGEPDFIVHDEAHTAPERAAVINDHFPNARILGLTATPYRAHIPTLDPWYDVVAFRMEAGDLIRQGWVTPLLVQGLDPDFDFRSSNFDREERRIAPVYRKIACFLRDKVRGRRVLVFHPLIKSSQLFTEICRAEGLASAHCDGNTRDRKGAIAAFERGDIEVMSNSSVFGKGVDFIRADCLLNLDLTRSVGKFRQRVGRIMRVLPDVLEGARNPAERRAAIAGSAKPDALILDLLGQNGKLGIVGAPSLFAHNADEHRAMTRLIAHHARAGSDPQRLEVLQAAVLRAKEEALLWALQAGQTSNAQRPTPNIEWEAPVFPPNRFAPGTKEAKLDTIFASMMT